MTKGGTAKEQSPCDGACLRCRLGVRCMPNICRFSSRPRPCFYSLLHTHTLGDESQHTGKWYVLYQNAHNAGRMSEWVSLRGDISSLCALQVCAHFKASATWIKCQVRRPQQQQKNAGTCSAAQRISASWTQKNRSTFALSRMQVGKKHSCAAVALLGNPISAVIAAGAFCESETHMAHQIYREHSDRAIFHHSSWLIC